MKCWVLGCQNYSGKPNLSKEFRFHGFPKEPSRFRAWEKACGQKVTGKTPFVCSVHFTPESVMLRDRILGVPPNKMKLSADAIPTENLPTERSLPDYDEKISDEVAPSASTTSIDDVELRRKMIEELIAEHDLTEERNRALEMERIAKENPIVGMEEIFEDTGNVVWISPDDLMINEEEKEEADQKSFSNSCRLCLADINDEDNATNLFLPIEGYGCVSQELFSMFQIMLSESPQSSSKVCGVCLEFLRNIKLFKEKINLSQKTFQMIPSTSDSTMKTSPQPDSEEMDERDLQEDFENQSDNDSDYFLSDSPILKIKETTKLIERTFEDKAQLEELMKTMNLLNCDICKEETESFSELATHQRDEHHPTVGYLFCCDQRWSYSDQAYDHMAFHQNPDTLKCWPCDEQFMCIGDLQRHQRKNHDRFICEICSKKFKRLWGLKQHQMIHREKFERSDKCSYCGKWFAGKQTLKMHIERVHEIEIRCVCDVCGKWFSNSNTLWTHRKNHEVRGQRGLITCSICKREVRSLSFHMRVKHNIQIRTDDDLEKIPCPTCGVKFARYSIQMHIYRQHKEKTCKFCPLKFVSYSEWMAHKNEHLGLQFPCQYCEKVWTTNLGRYFHVKSCHPEEHKVLLATRRKKRMGMEEPENENDVAE